MKFSSKCQPGDRDRGRIRKFPHSPAESTESTTLTAQDFKCDERTKDPESNYSGNGKELLPRFNYERRYLTNQHELREKCRPQLIWRRSMNKLNESRTSESTCSDSDEVPSKSKMTTLLFEEACFPIEGPIALEYKFHGRPDARGSQHVIRTKDSRLTYGVLDCSGYRFLPGFPFTPHPDNIKMDILSNSETGCREKAQCQASKTSGRKLFPITFCPPHDLELVTPSALKYLSFDLGFTVFEREGIIHVSSVTSNSPAELAGVQTLDTIRFAFEHSLASSFHNYALTPSERPSSASISVISHVEPLLAVYHPTEKESELAAQFAFECIENGDRINYKKFCELFVFDVTKSRYAHKPISFENRDEPVLYPITIVFERGNGLGGTFNLDLKHVRRKVDDTYSRINPLLELAFSCVNA